MNSSSHLKRFWRGANDQQIFRVLREARASVSAFADATQAYGSLLQNWTAGAATVEYEHYPSNDIIDQRNGFQFYYHSHRDGNKEHGHLHLFWHATASGRRRYLRPGEERWVRSAPTHLFAISLDARGLPVGLFSVNQWVTDGHWFDAATISSFVERFRVAELEGYEHACRWLTGFVQLYRPLVDQLLLKRDQRLARRTNLNHALRDKNLDLLSFIPIDWAADLDHLEAEATRRGL